jgi:hypothetical protein
LQRSMVWQTTTDTSTQVCKQPNMISNNIQAFLTYSEINLWLIKNFKFMEELSRQRKILEPLSWPKMLKAGHSNAIRLFNEIRSLNFFKIQLHRMMMKTTGTWSAVCTSQSSYWFLLTVVPAALLHSILVPLRVKVTVIRQILFVPLSTWLYNQVLQLPSWSALVQQLSLSTWRKSSSRTSLNSLNVLTLTIWLLPKKFSQLWMTLTLM